MYVVITKYVVERYMEKIFIMQGILYACNNECQDVNYATFIEYY